MLFLQLLPLAFLAVAPAATAAKCEAQVGFEPSGKNDFVIYTSNGAFEAYDPPDDKICPGALYQTIDPANLFKFPGKGADNLAAPFVLKTECSDNKLTACNGVYQNQNIVGSFGPGQCTLHFDC